MAKQIETSKHLDLSSRRVRDLVKAGVLPPPRGRGGYDLTACRLAYIQYLRSLIKGYGKSEGEDYDELLKMEKWRAQKRENDLQEELVAPVELITDAIVKTAAQVTAVLESLPVNLKRAMPELSGDAVDVAKREIARCRNYLSSMEIDLS